MQNEFILGIDEVGRGCLAGPVFISGVALNLDWSIFTNAHSALFKSPVYINATELQLIEKVRDSKKIKPETRVKIAELISNLNFPSFTLQASNNLIDEYGIGVCISHMIYIGILEIESKLELEKIIIDGKIKLLDNPNKNLLDKLFTENKTEILDKTKFKESYKLTENTKIIRENFADDKYLSVALASNLAKVKRDELMINLDNAYPKYDWKTNKGYGTLKHRSAILEFPKNDYFRYTFLKKILS